MYAQAAAKLAGYGKAAPNKDAAITAFFGFVASGTSSEATASVQQSGTAK